MLAHPIRIAALALALVAPSVPAIATAQEMGEDRSDDVPRAMAGRGCIEGDCTSGQGTFVEPTGAYYTGEWQDSVARGAGIYVDDEGTIFTGEFHDGIVAGPVTASSVLGISREGTFHLDGRSVGVFFAPDGEPLEEGPWDYEEAADLWWDHAIHPDALRVEAGADARAAPDAVSVALLHGNPYRALVAYWRFAEDAQHLEQDEREEHIALLDQLAPEVALRLIQPADGGAVPMLAWEGCDYLIAGAWPRLSEDVRPSAAHLGALCLGRLGIVLAEQSLARGELEQARTAAGMLRQALELVELSVAETAGELQEEITTNLADLEETLAGTRDGGLSDRRRRKLRVGISSPRASPAVRRPRAPAVLHDGWRPVDRRAGSRSSRTGNGCRRRWRPSG